MSTRNFSIAAMSSYSALKASYAAKSLALVDVCTGVAFGKSGYRAYVMEDSTQQLRQYNLAAPWDITSSTSNYAVTPPSAGSGKGLAVDSLGDFIYRFNNLTAKIEQYNFATGSKWELSSLDPATVSVSVAAQDSQPMDITFSVDGSGLYVLGFTNKRVYQYKVATPWNLRDGITYTGNSLLVSAQEASPQSMEFNPSGTVLYVAGDNDTVYQYNLTTPWDLTTAAYSGSSFSVAAQCVAVTGIAFKPDGLGFVLQGPPSAGAVSNLFQYNLT